MCGALKTCSGLRYRFDYPAHPHVLFEMTKGGANNKSGRKCVLKVVTPRSETASRRLGGLRLGAIMSPVKEYLSFSLEVDEGELLSD